MHKMSLKKRLQYEYDVMVRRTVRMLFQIKMRLTGDKRSDGYPYVTGDGFRSLADHIYDEQVQFDPQGVKKGDIVFVGQEMLWKYFEEIHPDIKEKYVLVCHNGDIPVDEALAAKVDEKIGHFFAQDLVFEHKKITAIPIGMENLHYYIAGPTYLFRKIRRRVARKAPIRKNKIFFNFSMSTNPSERGAATDYLSRHPHTETVDHFLTPIRHAKTLTTYKFVASPPGRAIESCRTWEALYLRTIPIVKDFVAMKYFKSLGLPIWVISDWSELDGLTDEALGDIYENMMLSASWDALHVDFWIKKIKAAQNKLRTESNEI